MQYFQSKDDAGKAILDHQEYNCDTYYTVKKGKRGFYVNVSVKGLRGTVYRL
jgi:hypothetical protein